MRAVPSLIVLAVLANVATPADPPAAPKVDKGREVLKAMEGRWVLKSATAATPECTITSVFDNPTVCKPGLAIAGDILDMTMKDQPVLGGRSKLTIGTDTECVLMSTIFEPGQTSKSIKCRMKVEGDTLTLVQDMSHLDEYPESFDPKKGRDRGRAITTYVREKPNP